VRALDGGSHGIDLSSILRHTRGNRDPRGPKTVEEILTDHGRFLPRFTK
jgi:hypothetical protein